MALVGAGTAIGADYADCQRMCVANRALAGDRGADRCVQRFCRFRQSSLSARDHNAAATHKDRKLGRLQHGRGFLDGCRVRALWPSWVHA